MAYVAKPLKLKYQEIYFRKDLESIRDCVTNIGTISKYDAELMHNCTQKIIAQSDKLPADDALEMIHGLCQIMNIMASRMNDANILTRFMGDPEFVPSECLLKIIDNPLLQESCNLPEALIPKLPKHMRDWD